MPTGIEEAVLAKVGGSLLASVLGGAWKRINAEDAATVMGRVYKRWREGVEADDAKDADRLKAFTLFFEKKPVMAEFEKLLRDHYQDLDVEVLTTHLLESYQDRNCSLPQTDLFPLMKELVEGLHELVEAVPEYREKYQLQNRAAIENLKKVEPGLRNFSLARHAYLRELRHQHGLIRFKGFAEAGGPTEVRLESVFVMPDLEGEGKKPRPAEFLLKEEAARTVILGKPGAGKTTLLEYLALQMAKSHDQPLPVFYRLRHLEEDRNSHSGKKLWECLHAHCAGRLNLDLPPGFFAREMQRGGLLILLDGLDEVVNETRRMEMVEFIESFFRGVTQSRVIVTSRPHDYGRIRFTEQYRHFELQPFNDEQIQAFIGGWHRVHEPDQAQRTAKGDELRNALEQNERMKELASNALLLTMMVRVHWTQGLPDSRKDLYAKCADTLLKYWSEAAGIGEDPLGLDLKRQFLAKLAFEMQNEGAVEDQALQVRDGDLRKKLDSFLKDKDEPLSKTELLMNRLHKRDAILVNLGGGEFSFVHRSFQEYFASYWLAEEEESRLPEYLDRAGWNETVCLAAAQLPAQRLRKFLVHLLKESRVELALECLRAAGKQDAWIKRLVEWMAKYTVRGLEELSVKDCAAAVVGKTETVEVLRSILVHQRSRTVGAELAAAIELADELQLPEAAAFWAECKGGEDMVPVAAGEFIYQGKDRIALAAFKIDRHPVTNIDYERMAPGHREKRDNYSSDDTQPVIYVNWYEARLYAKWRGCRLPNEREWEKAAAWDPEGRKARVYPWGDVFDESLCNSFESGLDRTTPVGSYPLGASAYGCQDMAGNVWEWTASDHEEWGKRVRGASFVYVTVNLRAADRYWFDPAVRIYVLGFRCVREVFP